MTHYLLSVHTAADEARPPMTEEEISKGFEKIGMIEADMRAVGALVFSGRLAQPDTASVVTNARGQISVADGPFVEAKEYLGGFYVIEAADLDEAIDWASRTSEAVGKPIEIWPFQGVALATGTASG